MYNTGQYLAVNVKPQDAVIRTIAYYDYVARIYRLQNIEAPKASWYRSAMPPLAGSLHNPGQQTSQSTMASNSIIPGMDSPYKPYVGTLYEQITLLIEANQTNPPFNNGFVLLTMAGDVKVDPRPPSWWVTELERIWLGPSERYDPFGIVLLAGIAQDFRKCTDFIYFGYLEASPTSCGNNFQDCCPYIDAPGFIATTCGIGVAPTLCTNSTRLQMEPLPVPAPPPPPPPPPALGNTIPAPPPVITPIDPLLLRWPYPFRVITWAS